MVCKIATGQFEGTPIERECSYGGKAGTIALSPFKRSEIASLAAKERWQEEGRKDMQTPDRKTVARGHEVVRMYPNNKLGPQVREFADAFSGFDLLRNLVKSN